MYLSSKQQLGEEIRKTTGVSMRVATTTIQTYVLACRKGEPPFWKSQKHHSETTTKLSNMPKMVHRIRCRPIFKTQRTQPGDQPPDHCRPHGLLDGWSSRIGKRSSPGLAGLVRCWLLSLGPMLVHVGWCWSMLTNVK